MTPLKTLRIVFIAWLVLSVTASPLLAADTKTWKPAAAVWKQAQQHMNALHDAIDDNRLSAVHKHAFALSGAVNKLPAASPALSAASMAKLKKGVQTVAALAKQLDAAGDAGRASDVHNLHKRLDVVMGAIEKLYPAGALK